jgi:hypothetical protein
MKRRESGKPGASQAQPEPSLEEGMYYEKVFDLKR